MTFEEIQELIKQVNQSNITKLNLDFDGGHLSMDKEAAPVAADKTIQPQAIVKKEAPQAAANVTQIKAPLVGIVYLQASPEKPQYKKVGDHVKPGDVVCVIEAMKMMTEIKSEVSGTISKMLVSNEEVVEFDQPLIEVTPD
ncbi:acetyl-CoA carboxylase biotin carboxyl carrier protein subunit [Lactobacillus sp. ESL0791]|uniref:acetyl-CoA carboxylase biotin carboxyl carrier protein n=1 Tax=Lactobacillus sp. ESL0791 TaxID=2983234 RepID=UPI0023F66E94|nr:biotin/lipoyl-containing protein [Lactobacillus sp. ESL0791]MDF7639533.1 acetyl-CoA carboxylase biotin carboxyl carrier protein subunit [Lactobacillus sp. ESL0791]